mmetsp:Transcript_26575/g.58065  ORF Transcript_26575/g.58065 Transcript_26575/m.58065 type:complete len:228 (-) Transcript_26575:6-689(-)
MDRPSHPTWTSFSFCHHPPQVQNLVEVDPSEKKLEVQLALASTPERWRSVVAAGSESWSPPSCHLFPSPSLFPDRGHDLLLSAWRGYCWSFFAGHHDSCFCGDGYGFAGDPCLFYLLTGFHVHGICPVSASFGQSDLDYRCVDHDFWIGCVFCSGFDPFPPCPSPCSNPSAHLALALLARPSWRSPALRPTNQLRRHQPWMWPQPGMAPGRRGWTATPDPVAHAPRK